MDDTTTPVVPSDPTQPVQGTDVPVGGSVVPPTPAEPAVPVTPEPQAPVTPTVPPVQEPTVVLNQEPVPPVTPPVGGTDQGGTQGVA